MQIRLFVIFAMMLAHSLVHAAPKAELWARWQKHDPTSTQKIDHSPWDRFLRQYVVAPHPSGINRVRYHVMTPEDLQSLYGGSDSVALSGCVDSRHQHFAGLVGARALGCEATHGGKRKTLARRYRTSYLEAYLER